MKKIAWPWIGTVEHEMGSMSPDGDFKDIEQGTQERHDLLVPEKSVLEDQTPFYNYENGIISPVEDVSYAKDKLESDEKIKVEILDEDGPLASFSCDVANTLQKKILGLQPYDSLSSSAGLIFPYKNPEDVIYHMGTVKFPIDIIFVDKNDKIKKIYKNIKPGTLGTFGCSEVKNVLEIRGGLSDRLGISKNNKIKIFSYKESSLHSLNDSLSKFGLNKDIILKYSYIGRNSISNWNNFPIYNLNSGLNKNASENKTKIYSSLLSKFNKPKVENTYVFDFDGLIEKSPNIITYKTKDIECDDDIPFLKLDGHTVSLAKNNNGEEIIKIISATDVSGNLLKDNYSILFSENKSFNLFLTSNGCYKDSNNLLNKMRKLNNKKNKIILATRYDNPKYIRDLIANKYRLYFGEFIDLDYIKLHKESDAQNIIEKVKSIYKTSKIKIFSDDSILKRAGVPISDEVKSRAKTIYRILNEAQKSAEESLDNMKKNLSEYEKIKDQPEKVKSTKGQYHQSVKRNTSLVKKYLTKIRDAIRIFNDIKDISSTSEIMDSLANSAKSTSESIEVIFDLIKELESIEFYFLLSDATSSYERAIEDLIFSIERGKNYVNSNILGLIILSD